MAQLFEATTLGPFRLKNRIIRSATNEHLSDKEGNLTPEITAAYEELARTGDLQLTVRGAHHHWTLLSGPGLPGGSRPAGTGRGI